MTNHPNRNWRSRMREAAAQWLDGPASVLWRLPVTPGKLPEAIRGRMDEAFRAGYELGRTSRASKPKEPS